jgi:proteasome lid subunit RPN8/RPN11
MDSIFHHAEQCAPRECCGLVVEENNNKIYIPLKNISEEKDRFEMDAKTFVTYQLKSNIKYVVHSHYDEDCKPSQHDIDNCNAVGIPYHYILEPNYD